MYNFDDVEFGQSAFWTWDAEMYEKLRWLRENDPVYWSEKDQMFVLTTFEDVAFVSKNNAIFCSGEGVIPGNPARLGLIDEDEPRHTTQRSLINRGFTPRMVKKLEIAFQELTDEALDAIAKAGRTDFVEDVAVPLPLKLIAAMIGIRSEDYDRFHEWSDSMIGAQGNMSDPDMIAKAGQAFVEYASYVSELFDDRRENPRDDLISILVHAKDEGLLGTSEAHGERISQGYSEEQLEMSKDELIKFCVLLLVAGNETTRNALSGAMKLLIENPEARQRLIDEPELIPTAVEELLRLTSPVISFVRTATQDTELRGQKIRQGQRVLMLYASANRDASQFENPDALQVERNPHHLAFGLGNHFCMGANLARMEMRVALREILRRFPDMEYAAGGPEMGRSSLVRSCMHLHLNFTPEA